jgi:hypothetical protein
MLRLLVTAIRVDRHSHCGVSSTFSRRNAMYLIRDIMYCKPGKVKPMIEKYRQMQKISEKAGMGKMRILTDVTGEQFWTIISENEVETIDEFMSMDKNMDADLMKQFETIMKDYHDLVVKGRREIFKIES